MKIVGYFSIPSPALAGHNPTAYALAMAGAPAGAGTCSHCGTGILHHVVIEEDGGARRFVGVVCAEKIGCDREQVHRRMTEAQWADREARRSLARSIQEERAQHERDRLARRLLQVGDITAILRATGQAFHASLAEQLELGPLTDRQAHFVAKATSATGRRNKRNAAAWDEIEQRCTEETQ